MSEAEAHAPTELESRIAKIDEEIAPFLGRDLTPDETRELDALMEKRSHIFHEAAHSARRAPSAPPGPIVGGSGE